MTKSLARTCRLGLGLSAWAALLGVALSISALPGDWGHSICGPWGCGPPLQSLVACHLAWFVVLLPPAALLLDSTHASVLLQRRVGLALFIASAGFLTAIVVNESLTWWPAASDWQRGYFAHRCGFVIGTSVDLPAVQCILIGLVLMLARRRTA